MTIKDLNRNGFSRIRIPKNLINRLSKSILNDLNYKLFKDEKKINELNVIQKSILEMPDSLFLSNFGHTSQRHLTSSITTELNLWVKDQLNKKFKFSKTRMTYVHRSDVLLNKRLKHKSFKVFYRIVRFNKKKDVGFLHRDNDFWNVGGKSISEIMPSAIWKVWIPIFGCNKKNTLKLIPRSHLHNIKANYVKKHGRLKPKISNEYFKKNIKNCVPGIEYNNKLNAVFFSDKTLHFGPKNISSKLRISAEFTVFTK